MNLLICIGGTGQLVLHYYAQWHLLGLEGENGPLRAVLIDQDQPIRSLGFLRGFFESIAPDGLLPGGKAAPWVRSARLELPDDRTQVARLLGDADPLEPLHPARAFLDTRSLSQQVADGLLARPSLAPVLWERHGGSIVTALDAACNNCNEPGRPTKVVVVASVLGGAGGGLVVPVVQHLIDYLRGSGSVAAVLFDQYFDADALDRSKLERQKSNADGVFATLFQRFQGERFMLRHFVVLKGSVRRDKSREDAAQHLPWPEPSHPFAEACHAVSALFLENVTDNPATPQDLRLEAKAVADGWARAQAALDRAIGGLTFLTTEGAIRLLVGDPLAERIWGVHLPRFVLGHWQAWAQRSPGAVRHFPEELARRVGSLCEGPGYSLRTLLPESHARGEFLKLRQMAAGLPLEMPSHPDTAIQVAQRAAAQMLFYLLLQASA